MKKTVTETKPYLKDIIIDLQKSGTWKYLLTVAINFTSSKGSDEEQVLHSKSDDIELINYDLWCYILWFIPYDLYLSFMLLIYSVTNLIK